MRPGERQVSQALSKIGKGKEGNWKAGAPTEFKLIPARARRFFFFRLAFRPRRWFHHIFIGPASGILSFLVRMAVSRSRIVFCIVHIFSTQQRPYPVGFAAIPR
jgi:hypothetical protein